MTRGSAGNSEFYPLPGMTGVIAGTFARTSYPAAGPYTLGVWDTQKVAKVGVFLNITGITGAAEPIIQLIGFSAAPRDTGVGITYFNVWEGSLSGYENYKRQFGAADKYALWFNVFAPYSAVRVSMQHQAAAIKLGVGRGCSVVLQRKRG